MHIQTTMTMDQQCAKPNGVIGKQTVLDNRRNTTIGQVDCCKNVGLLSRYGCQPPPGVPIVQRIQTLPKKSWKHAFQRIQTLPNKSWKHAFQRLPAYLDRSTHHSVHGLCRVKGVVNSARCKGNSWPWATYARQGRVPSHVRSGFGLIARG